jgi:multidrug efflux system outer membrane protein
MARLERQRNSNETALAILTGTAAPLFSITEIRENSPAIPAIPPALPSELLERRPDVAAGRTADGRGQRAHWRGQGGILSCAAADGFSRICQRRSGIAFQWEGRIWSIGPSLSMPLFAGGRNRATLARARSAYEEATATYRQQVLVAFGEVQENLTALQLMGTEAAAVDRTAGGSRPHFSVCPGPL